MVRFLCFLESNLEDFCTRNYENYLSSDQSSGTVDVHSGGGKMWLLQLGGVTDAWAKQERLAGLIRERRKRWR